MTRYYQTANGYGSTDDDTLVYPEDWTEITQEQYDALIAADQATADQAAADALHEAQVRWTTVHDGLISAGVAEPVALILANATGIQPQ